MSPEMRSVINSLLSVACCSKYSASSPCVASCIAGALPVLTGVEVTEICLCFCVTKKKENPTKYLALHSVSFQRTFYSPVLKDIEI